MVTVLITLYKKSGLIDPFFITQCISSLLKEVQNREAQIIDPILVKMNIFYVELLFNPFSQSANTDRVRLKTPNKNFK